MALVERVVGAQILVEADAKRVAAHDDALVEGTYLGVDFGNIDGGQQLAQTAKGYAERRVEVVSVGILALDLGQHGLQRGVLEVMEELGFDFGVVDLAEMQHVLQQQTGLTGIVSIHLLKGGIVAGGQVEALYAVVALDADFRLVGLHVGRLQLPLATDAHRSGQEQEEADFSHGRTDIED